MRRILSCAFLVAPLVFASIALAAKNDAAAKKLDEDAMGNDYLATQFARAEKKLKRALSLCEKSRCSPGVAAILHRDLFVVYFAGMGRPDDGKKELEQAFAADPNVTLDKDIANRDMIKVFDELDPKKKREREKAIDHEPVTEQRPATAIPLLVTPRSDVVAKVIVRYRKAGDETWQSAPMHKRKGAWVGEIPCGEVHGEEIDYTIEAFDAEGGSVGRAGTRDEPLQVAIRKRLEGDAPHLPDESPPSACAEAPSEEHAQETPTEAPNHLRSNWISLSVEQDLGLVTGNTTDVCTGPSQVDGPYSCFRASGSQYHGYPVLGEGDNINSGIAFATTRVLLGYDRVIAGGFTLGVRFGAVFRGASPAPEGEGAHAFLPVHAEARASYFFGSDVFMSTGVRPYLFAAGGFAQVDAQFTTPVKEDMSKPPPPNQPDNPPTQTLDVYRHAGQGFAGGGAGVFFELSPGAGVLFDAKVMQMFPTSGTVISPELGAAIGF